MIYVSITIIISSYNHFQNTYISFFKSGQDLHKYNSDVYKDSSSL